jgi:predicted transglutaminase-like cysteine proteinase
MGSNKEKLRRTYVKALEINKPHMVLSYFAQPNVEPLVLDNLNAQILPASQ